MTQLVICTRHGVNHCPECKGSPVQTIHIPMPKGFRADEIFISMGDGPMVRYELPPPPDPAECMLCDQLVPTMRCRHEGRVLSPEWLWCELCGATLRQTAEPPEDWRLPRDAVFCTRHARRK